MHKLFFALIGGASLLARHSSAKPITCSANVPLFDYEKIKLTADAVPSKYTNLFAFNTSGPTIGSGECKVFPGDAAWPSPEEWDAFNELLDGALLKTVPIAAPCYQNWGVYDAGKCEALIGNWTSPYTHMNDPTSVMWPVYEGRTCLPSDKGSNSTCSIGAYPTYAVNATTVAQIQLAVNFARNKGLRIVIKNTGHDYLGKSCGAGALSIWTYHLKSLEYMSEYTLGNFTGKALHVGSGARSLDVQRIAYENDASVVGGMCASVGFAGGYFAGGGLSPLSSLFGMAADHVLAIGVVTADGQYMTATAESHPDLFWAMRGGGASTWGVVTSIIVRLLPNVQTTTSQITIQTSAEVSNETFWEGVRAYFENFERLTDRGFYGYTNIRRNYSGYNNSDLSLGVEPIFAPNNSIASFNEVIKPFFDRLTELGIPYTNEPKHFDTFYEGWTDAWPDDELVVAGPATADMSWAFPREIWTDPEGLNASLNAIRKVNELGNDVGGFAIAPRNPFDVDNAVSPAWRHALGYFNTGVLYPEDSSMTQQMAAAAAELLTTILDPWREVAPPSKNGGSYVNEANPMEPHWQDDFWGDNYPRLLGIKRTYDPYGVFYATTAVGSEEWEVRTKAQGIQTQNVLLCRL